MTRLHRPARAAVVLTSLVALLGTVGPAEAGSWSRPDPRGDGSGSTYSPEPPPCGTVETTPGVDPTTDVTRLRVQHRRQVVRVRVTFADLRRDPDQSATVHLLTPELDVDVELVTARGRTRALWLPGFQSQVEEASGSADECDGFFVGVYEGGCRGLSATTSVRQDRVAVLVPRSCLDRPRWVRAGVTATTDVDGRLEVDRWEPRDGGASRVAELGSATYGARVRAPARA